MEQVCTVQNLLNTAENCKKQAKLAKMGVVDVVDVTHPVDAPNLPEC